MEDKRSKLTPEHKQEAAKLKALWDRSSSRRTQAVFGEHYELGNQANVGHYLNARSALNPKAATAFATELGCRIEEFSPRIAKEIEKFGAGLSVAMRPPTKANSNVTVAAMGTVKIPLISYVQAGVWTEAVDSFHPGDADDWLLTDLELSGLAFALQIKGDSMLPEFNPGDRVIIDPDVAPQPGDFVVAKNGHEEATFKKYRPRSVDANGNTIFELVPLNEDYASIRSDITPVKIVGTMVEHRKYRRAR